ncbi:formate dehydrogenase accessory sulfurtransferase FdhD [Methanofollis fontis]|uniref:Formate dehydrogenase family accessory protein FdhD n=1 Tax=Methanofollis fontis TaxID=2052832 RepID=A0A483CQT2_9EURY|nr:formate dehydrogenase accessory sulfurtransferase FdhD [Methanofollis fontis]TAJ44531.1 formate dehydrogenase family accessory protein FdhD [Methanofollis fontis]
MDLYSYTGIQVRNGEIRKVTDDICIESRFDLFLNDEKVTGIVASDEQIRELGAGFVIAEGLCDQISGVVVEGAQIRVTAPVRPGGERVLETSGGTAFVGELPVIATDLTIGIEDVYRMTAAIESEDWRRTGGLHCSVLFCDGELCAKACDVGRHNTVDKVIGHAVLSGLDRSRCVIGCTGRQPSGMVSKAARAGIPIIISRAASTDGGIRTASGSGITLICFSRGDRFTIYTHPERVDGVGR